MLPTPNTIPAMTACSSISKIEIRRLGEREREKGGREERERGREREKEGGGSNVLRKNVRYDQRSILADGPIIRPKSPESQSTEVFFTAALTVCQKAPCVAEI